MAESIPTREADFDKETKYLLFDDLMAQVEQGELSREQAFAMYLSALSMGGFDGSAE